MAENQIKSVNWWHEQLATWLLSNPDKMLSDAAKHFGVTQPWISIVKNSDAFIDYYARRVDQQFEGSVLGVTEKTRAMTEMALDAILTKLETNSSVMTTEQLLEVSKTGLRAMGYGANAKSPAPSVNLNIAVVNQGELAAARERMHALSGIRPAEAATQDAPKLITAEAS